MKQKKVRSMKMVVNIAKNFAEAEKWDIEQQINMSANERFAAVNLLKKRVYGSSVKDVRECHQNT